jgi:cell filamentation protein
VRDPYLWPDAGCLRNKLDIRDPDELHEVESRLAAVRDTELSRSTTPGQYDLEHLRAFHRRLFGDVYEWAGRTRTVDISKPGARFCNWKYVDTEVTSVLRELAGDSWLTGLKYTEFVERLAYYYGELNVRHPFREGNGRTQRAFFRQLAAAGGWRLDWARMTAGANVAACVENLLTAGTAGLVEVLGPVVMEL